MPVGTNILSSLRVIVGALLRPGRRAAAAARDRLQRTLHPRRSRRARAAVLAAGPVGEVLFVCLGNICRSPYAEHRLRLALDEAGVGDAVRVRSTGFFPPGRSSPDDAVAAAAERGVDLAPHRSDVVSNELLRHADLILVMTSKQLRDLRWNYGRPDTLHLGDLEPPPIPRRDLTDPYGKPLDSFREVYGRIDRAMDTLAALIAGGATDRSRSAGAGADAVDPAPDAAGVPASTDDATG